MKTLLTVILLTLSLNTLADKKYIIGGFSKHMGYPVPLNEVHPGVGVETNNIELAVYQNSLDRESFAVAYVDRPWYIKGVKVGYRLGVASGYPDDTQREGYDGRMYNLRGTYNGFMPQAQLVFSKGFGPVYVDLGVAPVTTLTFKVR